MTIYRINVLLLVSFARFIAIVNVDRDSDQRTQQQRQQPTNQQHPDNYILMKTTKTLTLAIALFCFFLGAGTQTSLAQEAKNVTPQSNSAGNVTTGEVGIEYTSPDVSFLRLNKLTEPLKDEARIEMVKRILDIIKKEKNKKVPDLKSIIQGVSLSSEYYEIAGDLSGRKLTVQHIPPVTGKNAGNISLSWDEKDEKGKAIQDRFVSLFLDGSVETALDSEKNKLMVSSDGKISVGAQHQKFWQLQADQILQELAEVLPLTGKLK